MTKSRSNATAPAAKGELVIGTGTDASGILSVGANDTVLTADSSTSTGLKWASPSAGSLILISTTSFSAVNTQSFNNVFSSTYDYYKIFMRFYSSSNNAINMRLRASGTDASGGNYGLAVRSLSAGAALATEFGGSGATAWTLGNLPTTASTTPNYIEMTMLYPYQTASYKSQVHHYVQGDGQKGGYGWGSQWANGTAYDGFSIYNSTGGATTITGSVSIYGVSK